MGRNARYTFVIAALLAGVSAAPNPEVKSAVDRLYVIDCGDGSGPDESRWTPGVNAGTPVDFPGHCYLIHHTQQGWFLWDTGIDDAVARLPNHELVFHEWGPGTGPIWRKPVTLAAQLEEVHVKPSDIKLMAVSHSHGSLVLLSTPGHTPGHQSLLVRLPKTGPVILSGAV